jgi:hypothetical protein
LLPPSSTSSNPQREGSGATAVVNPTVIVTAIFDLLPSKAGGLESHRRRSSTSSHPRRVGSGATIVVAIVFDFLPSAVVELGSRRPPISGNPPSSASFAHPPPLPAPSSLSVTFENKMKIG